MKGHEPRPEISSRHVIIICIQTRPEKKRALAVWIIIMSFLALASDLEVQVRKAFHYSEPDQKRSGKRRPLTEIEKKVTDVFIQRFVSFISLEETSVTNLLRISEIFLFFPKHTQEKRENVCLEVEEERKRSRLRFYCLRGA